ncbi:MAG: phage Gp37/Gp68 family protein [Anaeroplasma bactoclasticum]|nr:phage Gp37/Gp68 family protein [Anaeroplasma bactoclasticum]
MNKTKIDWCDCTINPVVGCKNGCKYCYARKINQRFRFIENWEEPQFFPERLKQLNSKKPKSIFMDSMSDIGYWKEKYIAETFNVIRRNPQHNYIFLTKGIQKSDCFAIGKIFSHRILCQNLQNRQNIFIGKTIDKNNKFDPSEQYDFLSIEPILEPINLELLQYSLYVRQVILGAETGNRKEKVVPKKEWIDNIVKECNKANARVFMKESLRQIMGEDFRQDELIWKVDKDGK